jgi:hypothetical protein
MVTAKSIPDKFFQEFDPILITALEVQLQNPLINGVYSEYDVHPVPLVEPGLYYFGDVTLAEGEKPHP